VASSSGVVKEITLRHVIIRDFESRRIIIPNSTISDEKIKQHMEFDISHDCDITTAIKILREQALAHTLSIDNRTLDQLEEGAKLVPIKLVSLNDSSVKLRAWVWTSSLEDAFIMS